MDKIREIRAELKGDLARHGIHPSDELRAMAVAALREIDEDDDLESEGWDDEDTRELGPGPAYGDRPERNDRAARRHEGGAR